MTRLGLRIVLATICLLLTFVSWAHAECAWVLWNDEHWGSLEKSPLRPLGAFSNQNDCELVQKLKIRELAAEPPLPVSDAVFDKVDSSSNLVSVKRYRKATGDLLVIAVYRYMCLPDTVDPRGPKGK